MDRSFDRIETPRLILRRFRPEDSEPFFAYRTLPEVARFQSQRWLRMTQGEAAEFVLAQSEADAFVRDAWYQLAVERRDTGALIGDIGLHTPDDISQAELGFTIAPSYQHQGFALEAVGHLLDDLFTARGLHRVVAVADARNLPSIALLHKLGMRREGCFIKSFRDADTYTDEVQYAILEEEWRRADT
jgi:RimJ/RimL family protein N-acetyltransferase